MRAEVGPSVCEIRVEGYEVLHPIGSGGMGQVFLARQLPLGRLVALKMLAMESDDSEQRLRRFRREAELMAGLSHPNVLPVFQYGEVDGRPYLILEYIAHGDLRRAMLEGLPMEADRAMAILARVAEALAYLHSRGILHRDLKPENILMHEGAVPKVADFGVAVSLMGSGSLTRTGQRIGTLGYVAPEQHYQLDVDERADQYSLAALAYEMLTGQRALGICKPPSSHNPKLGPGVDAVVLKGLQELPRDRYPTVLEFASALEASLKEPPEDPAPNGDRRRLVPLVVGASLLLIAGFWATRPGRPLGPPGDWPPPPHHQGPPGERPPHLIPVEGPPAPGPPGPDKVPPAGKKSDAFHELTRLRARKLWEAAGRVPDQPEEKQKADWLEAEKQVGKEVDVRAFMIWKRNGAPEGPKGEAVREANAALAAKELLDEARSARREGSP